MILSEREKTELKKFAFEQGYFYKRYMILGSDNKNKKIQKALLNRSDEKFNCFIEIQCLLSQLDNGAEIVKFMNQSFWGGKDKAFDEHVAESGKKGTNKIVKMYA